MLCKEVQNYITTAKGLPFFYVVGDENYGTVLTELKQNGICVVRMSDFCLKEDKFPSIDNLVDYFRTSDVDYRDNKFVVVGLGEYLAIRGTAFAEKELKRLKTTTLGNARAILLLRGVSVQMTKLINDDKRIIQQERAFVSENTSTNISITKIPGHIEVSSHKGIKKLIYALEDGHSGNISVSSELFFENAIFPTTTISGAYAVLRQLIENFDVDESIGTEEQWNSLLIDFNKCNNNLSGVFSKYDIDEDLYYDLNQNICGLEYKNWLVFLYLKLNVDDISNEYFRCVVEETCKYEDLKNNLLVKIIDFSHSDSTFMNLYNDRKRLLKDFPETDIAVFMKANEIDLDESIYRYTDNTLLEKKAVIKWIVANGMTDAIEYVYPALNLYLKKYIFDCPVLADELTEYFEEYKRQKVTNLISDEFIKIVEKHAEEFSYAKLPTRDNAIKSIEDKNNAYLYWIDALGVEYLSYITSLAKKKGLSIHIDIVRCDLPTITSKNKLFYEQWPSKNKYKEEKLDNIKHKDDGGYFFTKDEDPIHLPEELEVIENAVNTAAMELAMHNYKSFIIASDHGASRLAVIKKQEVTYETDTKGEHSGRCCKHFDNCDLTYKVEDNGYIMLSDYGRFKGSRHANVEVHGGACLEEIVIPVITLTLKKTMGVIIKVMNPDNIKVERHKGVVLTVYISDVDSPNAVRIVVDDIFYEGKSDNGTHFKFELKDIKRTKIKPYTAEVFDDSNLIGNISFRVKGKTASVSDEFDDLF